MKKHNNVIYLEKHLKNLNIKKNNCFKYENITFFDKYIWVDISNNIGYVFNDDKKKW